MLDPKDKEIIRLLQRDCTLCLKDIATAVRLTPTPCRERIKRLEEKGVITGRTVLLSKDKLHLSTTFVMVRTVNHSPEWHTHFITTLHAMPEVTSVFRTSGKYDYLLQVVISDLDSYNVFYKNLIASVKGLFTVTTAHSIEAIKDVTQFPVPD